MYPLGIHRPEIDPVYSCAPREIDGDRWRSIKSLILGIDRIGPVQYPGTDRKVCVTDLPVETVISRAFELQV